MTREFQLENLKHIKFDKAELYRIYQNWPLHFTEAQSVTPKTDNESSYYNSILICGMGGSGTVCDVLGALLERFGTVPSMSVTGKILPTYINKHTLVIINSVSGDTAEALSSMEQAVKKNAEVICVSSGGKLKESLFKIWYQTHYHSEAISFPSIISLPADTWPKDNKQFFERVFVGGNFRFI